MKQATIASQNRRSNTTRIKTQAYCPSGNVMSRQNRRSNTTRIKTQQCRRFGRHIVVRIEDPIQQGLRRIAENGSVLMLPVRIEDPIQQGLRHLRPCIHEQHLCSQNRRSNTTRIKTQNFMCCQSLSWVRIEDPIQQGLRHGDINDNSSADDVRIEDPIQQGLRLALNCNDGLDTHRQNRRSNTTRIKTSLRHGDNTGGKLRQNRRSNTTRIKTLWRKLNLEHINQSE